MKRLMLGLIALGALAALAAVVTRSAADGDHAFSGDEPEMAYGSDGSGDYDEV